MADIVSAITGVVQCFSPCFNPLATHVGYVSKFDDNFNELRVALRDLVAKRDDVIRRVDEEELRGRVRLEEVKSWFLKVDPAIEKANKLVNDASDVQQRRSTSGCYCNNITSTYRCGKKIPKMVSEVRKLFLEQNSQVLTRQATLPVVVVVEVEEPAQQIVGFDTKLASTWSLLMDEGTRMLGLCGMGGIGKTTLLTLINDEFSKLNDKFDVVIWVDVSKDVDIGQIQDAIAKRLGLYDENWRQKIQGEKKGEILRVLKNMKPRFVLLLDGLWEVVSLSDIGIPSRGKQNKIVYTTRRKAVCASMGGIHIEVECLAEKDALDLLKQISGRDTLTGDMLDLAKEIARKCYCSPLAIQVIGKCLSSKTTEEEWRDVFNDLVRFPDQLEGMVENMLGVLKVSYDNLKEEDERPCFLYCALFPMAYSFHQDELVEYWIGESIIELGDGRERAKRRGVKIIETLVGAGLLLKDDECKQKVYMHSMIRDMALWIVSEIRDGKRFFVKTDAGLETLPGDINWTIVSKMSLMNNKIASIAESGSVVFPNPDRLVTLFLQNNELVNIVGRFFQVISTLVVLDLSHNPGIIELPNDIERLVFLRYLNLSGTRINNLRGIQELIQLIHLDLESTSNLRDISLILRLQRLQVLRFYGSKASLDLLLLEHLKHLKRLGGLELLTITVGKEDVLEAFLESELAGCTRGIYLEGLKVSGASFEATLGKLSSLSKLGLKECDITESETELEENTRNQCSSSSPRPSPSPSPSNQITPRTTWFKNLSSVALLSCEHIQDLTWLIYAENLEALSIALSRNMEELISEEKAAGVGVEPFRKLQVLGLHYLDELKSIYWSPLSFPSLQEVHITHCPKLRKLPLNSTSVTKIDDLIIEMDDGWTERIVWENGAGDRFRRAIRTASVSQTHQV
ncbi:hypothetical protein Bca4012_060041 [Brassica carinata]